MNYFKKDWPLIFILIFWITGGIWCLWDMFSDIDNFIWSRWRILGILMIIIGKVIEFWVRNILKTKANFLESLSTITLRINQDHKLITNGPFKHVRHPLYTGAILRGVGMAILSLSLYGDLD